VDIIGARHINPDFVVHFGDACLSDELNSEIPIEYVFPKLQLDLENFKAQVQSFKEEGKLNKDLLVNNYDLFLAKKRNRFLWM